MSTNHTEQDPKNMREFPRPRIKHMTTQNLLPIIDEFEKTYPGFNEDNWWEFFRGEDGTIKQSAKFRQVKRAYLIRQAERIIANPENST